MEFLKVFLRGIALLPSAIQGIETLYEIGRAHV